jgi:hypothetical protein
MALNRVLTVIRLSYTIIKYPLVFRIDRFPGVTKMTRLIFLLLILSSGIPVSAVMAQEPEDGPFKRLVIRPASPKSSLVKDIQVIGNGSGIAYTADSLFLTRDGGTSWQELSPPKDLGEKIASVHFFDENCAWVILADVLRPGLSLALTSDGGGSWVKTGIILRERDLEEADLANSGLAIQDGWPKLLFVRLTSSSNFIRNAVYSASNDGQTWTFESDHMINAREEDAESATDLELAAGENIVKISRTPDIRWVLASSGSCEGFKTGCVQSTRIYDASTENLKEITPPEIKSLSQAEKEKARADAQRQVFAAPPGGSTRLSLNRGFDKCTAAPAAQMQAWWNNSPFYDVNIYMSGRNRGCSQAQLTAAWINQVSAMGWGFIPTIVGYQSPCSVCTTCQKHSSDPATAETQGRGEADIAIADATNLGLLQGTVLYYDMERYDDVSGTGACSTPTKAFLKGWTDRLKETGYISGVYGSPFNANGDWINIPLASRMDAVWLARWNNIMSVWGVAPLPDNVWTNHQRIHQWLGPRDETWGGVTFNIDNNISDAPVAGPAIAKNKNADFDGDGKTDVSVYRPDSGSWYVLNSSNGVFTGVPFGIDTDIIAPGDYDGDGKTDYAVFRPGAGDWYIQTKAGFLTARHFGGSGDIPVPADFNGDGKTDVAVFRPSDGVWYIAHSDSLGTFNFTAFGQSGDKPVPADYDGDGKDDIAVFRPIDGNWYVLRSSDGNFTATHFGIATDRPAQGDYDGDGKADPAVFRDGDWFVLQSAAGFYGIHFGSAGDTPAAGDFDGDNKTDIAIYRPSDATWYILQSLSGYTAVNFGLAADRPIPSAYLPQ